MRYLTGLLCSFLILCALWTGLFYLQLGAPTPESQWINEAFEYKDGLALAVGGQKVLLVAGSNVLFGIDSLRLSKEWDVPVINHSVHAGLGTPYILSRARDILHQGDIALLPFEYELYLYDDKMGEIAINFIVSYDADYFRRLSIADKVEVISQLHPSRLFLGLGQRWAGELPPTRGVYGVHNIGEAGDQFPVKPERMTEANVALLDALTPTVFGSEAIRGAFIRTMDKFITWARENGVCVILTPPNLMYFEEYEAESYARFFDSITQYADGRGVAFVGDPYAYMFSRELYFNTVYHLNSTGVARRTDQMLLDVGDHPSEHCVFP